MSAKEKAKGFLERFSKLELALLIISVVLVVSVLLPFGYIAPQEELDTTLYPAEIVSHLESGESVGLFKYLTNDVFTLALMSWMVLITVLLIVVFSLMQKGRFALYLAALIECFLLTLLFFDVGVVSAFAFFELPVPYDYSFSVGSIMGMSAAAAGAVIQLLVTRQHSVKKKKAAAESDMPPISK